MSDVPSYAQLRRRADGPPGTAWGVFGSSDEYGTLNFLTNECVLRAVECVRSGATFNLDLPLDAFQPALIPTRRPFEHHIFATNSHHRDEYLDRLYTQAASQVDGLRHMGHPDFGFYNHADPERLREGDPLLGIQRFAERGIAGRGVLVDVARHLERHGRRIDHATNQAISIGVVDAAAREQGVELRSGDILMLRFGWVEHHLGADPSTATSVAGVVPSVGLAQSHETIEWLWDHQFSVVAADNISVEAWPPAGDSPLISEAERSGRVEVGPHTGLMHRVLIPLLGFVLGELWALADLAAACAEDGRYDSLVVVKPLNLPGGVGSPANATAIR